MKGQDGVGRGFAGIDAADQGLPTLGAVVRTFPITDRHGNAAALVAVIPVGRG